MKFPKGVKYIIGVDEAGRGPLAGPVSVGVCALPVKMTRRDFKGIRDSKKLSEKMRDVWFAKMLEMQKVGGLYFSVNLVSNKIIDERGISFAIKKAMNDGLIDVMDNMRAKYSECFVLLDGSLRAPSEFIFQKTIIKGDEKEFAISLASIAAKVTRDKYMKKMAKKYPNYGFEVHKGYGTAKHIISIKKEGISALHRKSFLKNIV